MKSLRALGALSLLFAFAGAQAQVGSGAVLFNGGATQDFDTLANTGTSDVLPPGWYFREAGSNANATYAAGNGNDGAGNTWSYGATSSAERAFGARASNSLQSTIGAQIQNATGAPLTQIAIAFTVEQWRTGDLLGGADRLSFSYSTDATSLSTGTWTAFDSLDAVAPVTTGTADTALDGNAAANRSAVAATISGLSVPAGNTFWIRWVDVNNDGADDALAIDDVVFGTPVDQPPRLMSSNPTDGEEDVAFDRSIVLTFSEPVTTSPDPWYTLTCGAPVASTSSGSGATRTIVPTGGLPFDATCIVDLDESRIVDSINQILVAGDGYTDFDFTTAEDVAPFVQSTIPADLAQGVATSATITIVFSEPVDVPPQAGDWIALTCTSGARSGVVTGTGNSRQFAPDSDFAPGDSCSFSLTAAAITDRDGTADTLTGQTTFTFDVAPDVAPSVASTFPVQGATNVGLGTVLTVTFDEAVDAVLPGAFVIECPVGTPIAHTATTSDQISFALTPIDPLPADTACRLTVVATEITDRDGTLDPMAANEVIAFTTGAAVQDYYARVDTSSCRALRATLHGVIDDHHAVVYSDNGNEWFEGFPTTYDVWEVLNLADEDPADTSRILDIYRNESYTKIAGGTGVYNREHVWPNSHGFNNIDTLDGFPNAPYTDTHMLMASNTNYNSRRGSRAFATCNPGTTPSCTIDPTIFNAANGDGGGPTSYPGSGATDHNWYTDGSDGGNGSYEVWDFRRGDLARAMLYMDLRYEGGTNSRNGQRETDLILTDNRASIVATPSGSFQTVGYSGLLTPLLAWAQGDQPTVAEGLRNDLVESVQGNRNPFVDHPEWIALAYANPCTGPTVVAVDDDFTLNPGTTLTAAAPGVLRDDHNGSNKNGQGLTVTGIVAAAAHGTATITNAATGAFTYTPNPGFCGRDEFTYGVTNGTDTDQAIAHLFVDCAPTATTDTFPIAQNSSANLLHVLANDQNPDGGPLFVQSVSQPAVGGTTTVGPAGARVSFTPTTGFCAPTSFTYTLNGGSVGTVNITMCGSNQAPVAQDAIFSLPENSPPTTVVGSVSASDPDPGTTLTYEITAGNSAGAFSMVGNQIVVASSVPLNFEVTPQFVLTIRVSDGATPTPGTDTAQITINLTNVNEAPSASDTSFGIAENSADETIVGSVSASDPDAGTTLVYTITGGNTGGAFGMNGNQIVVANSAALDFETTPVFTLTVNVSDGALSANAQVTINLANVNEAPTIAQSLTNRSAVEGVAITPFSVANGFSDPDAGTDLDFTQSGLPSGLILNEETGEISGTPAPGSFSGSPYTVTITANDGELSVQQDFQYTITTTETDIFEDGFED